MTDLTSTLIILLSIFGSVFTRTKDTTEKFTNPEPKIIGGTYAKITDFPYQVSVRHNNQHICGGSIYSSHVIITAGHCVYEYRMKADGFSIVAGTINRKDNAKTYQVKRVLLHPNYTVLKNQEAYNDVALLKLSTDLTLGTPELNAVPLRTSAAKSNTTCVVSGWGRTRSNNLKIPGHLKFVEVSIIDHLHCNKLYKALKTEMLCAGNPKQGGKDSCQGDSGGPLVCDGELTGVVSWGVDCGLAEYPGVYADIVSYREWIVENNSSKLSVNLFTFLATCYILLQRHI